MNPSVREISALIVDDSAAMRRQLAHALEGVPRLRSVSASDGAEGWKRLAESRFDILLTDINMPLMDGLKLISLVRAGGAHRDIPIVVISTEGAEADRRRALGLGASDFLVKPVQSQQVVAAVTRLLALE